MKLAIGALLLISLAPQSTCSQTTQNASTASTETSTPAGSGTPANSYVVFGATPAQEAALRAQIAQIHPDVLPLRVFFVPHWKYLDSARTFHLHVTNGFASVMFTHLPSRTVFIDNDRYLGEDWLGYWIAHEFGHLAKNNAREDDAEKAAHEYRKRLKQAHIETR